MLRDSILRRASMPATYWMGDFKLAGAGIVTYKFGPQRKTRELFIGGHSSGEGRTVIASCSDASLVLPVDWAERKVCLLIEARPSLAFARDCNAKAALDETLLYGASAKQFFVPGDSVHAIQSCAGSIEAGETDTEAAIRELREEIGYRVSNEQVTKIGVYSASRYIVNRQSYFIADVSGLMRHRPEHLVGGEILDAIDVTFSEVFEMLKKVQIEDSSLSVLLREVKFRELIAKPRA